MPGRVDHKRRHGGSGETALLILLIAADDVAAALAESLAGHRHELMAVPTMREGLARIDAHAIDALILARTVPDMDGLIALRWLRGGRLTLPVVMVAGPGSTADAIAGLDAGADDYLVTPVDGAELDARLRALMRGRRWGMHPADTLRVGAVTVSPARGRAWIRDRPLALSGLELKLLTELVRHAGTVMTRARLVALVWGPQVSTQTNIVDVHVGKLRRKLVAEVGVDPIVTVRGAGYLIDEGG